jgi:hypothetical protein
MMVPPTETYSVAEAAKELRKSERQVLRYLTTGRLRGSNRIKGQSEFAHTATRSNSEHVTISENRGESMVLDISNFSYFPHCPTPGKSQGAGNVKAHILLSRRSGRDIRS